MKGSHGKVLHGGNERDVIWLFIHFLTYYFNRIRFNSDKKEKEKGKREKRAGAIFQNQCT